MARPSGQLKDYYGILGVSPSAEPEEIRGGYRRLAKLCHPDMAAPTDENAARFREISEAYSVLKNAEKRKEYDRDRAAVNDPRWVNFDDPPEDTAYEPEVEPTRTAPKEDGWFDEDDDPSADAEWEDAPASGGLFDKVFGHSRPKGGTAKSRGQRDRQAPDVRFGDLETEVMVTLNEVLHGANRVLNLRRKGTSDQPRQFSIQIPAGVRPGHMIRLKGKGRTSLSRGTTGDLFVTVRYAQHPDFRVDGYDLHHELYLKPWQFVLGDIAVVRGLEGPIQVKIPPGSAPGQKLRVRSQGLPMDQGKQGSLVLRLAIEIPAAHDPAERKLWERMRQLDIGSRPEGG